ncbi:MAG: hypothetical protein ABIG45_05385 [Bacillota bacterium]
MKKAIIALAAAALLLCGVTAAAAAGVTGHFISEEDGTYVIILKEPISKTLDGVYIGNSNFTLNLKREDQKDGSTRIYTPLDESTAIIDLLLRYEDDGKQAALVSGDIARFSGEGALIDDQSMMDMLDVRFIRQEVPAVSELQGTRWNRYTMTISGSERSYPFDGSVIEFFDTEENAGQIPDNEVRTYPFTYEVDEDSLILKIEAGGETTEATVKIDSNVLIVKIKNSTLYFLPATP